MYRSKESVQINVDFKWGSTAGSLQGEPTAVDNDLLLSFKKSRASFHLVG